MRRSGNGGKVGKKVVRHQEAEGAMGLPMVAVVQMLLGRPVDVGDPQLPLVECPDPVPSRLVSLFDTAVVLGSSRE